MRADGDGAGELEDDRTVLAIAALAGKTTKQKRTKTTIVIGSKQTVVTARHRATIKVSLNATGTRLLRTHHHLKAKLTVSRSGKQVSSSTGTFVYKRR